MQKIKGQKKYTYQACANLNNDAEAILITDTIEFRQMAFGVMGIHYPKRIICSYELDVLEQQSPGVSKPILYQYA